MDILLFRDLSRLNETGNFSQAAASVNVSQSAFSRRIKSLEAWVGVQLVDRSCQPVKLTDAGSQMLEAGLQALVRIENERSQILESYSLPDKYVVTFGAQHSIGWRFYPAWLQTIEHEYGPILSRLRADDLHNCFRDLKNGDVDFVFAYANPLTHDVGVNTGQWPDEDSIAIGKDRLLPVSKPQKNGIPIYDIKNMSIEIPLLRFGDSAPISKHLSKLLSILESSRKLRTIYENSMAGALRIRARDGAGVAWLPESLVAPDLASGSLVETGLPEWTVDLEIRLFRSSNRSNHLTRSVWSFLQRRS